MQKPKTLMRYCKHCKKHTEHKVSMASSGHKRGSLKKGGMPRARKRGLARGLGSRGKWGSKPAVTKFKRKTKSTKKTNLVYTCQVCKKASIQKKGKRVGKIILQTEADKKAKK